MLSASLRTHELLTRAPLEAISALASVGERGDASVSLQPLKLPTGQTLKNKTAFDSTAFYSLRIAQCTDFNSVVQNLF